MGNSYGMRSWEGKKKNEKREGVFIRREQEQGEEGGGWGAG